VKISVITPSLNSADHLEKAICSVLDQDYKNYEHIVVDGGSTDGTIDILKKYGHLKWISEKDRGQSHAMNKGFRMSTGEAIVYLMADDYFLCGAFSSVARHFEENAKFVVGDIVVMKESGYFINRPKVKLWQMIRHWEENAFPYNPVGYFYTREVQEAVPFNENNHKNMDLEFLLESALMFDFTRIDSLLGVYRCMQHTKTVRDQMNLCYWTKENFALIDKYAALMPRDYQIVYDKERALGYQLQRQWQITGMLKHTPEPSMLTRGLVAKVTRKVKGLIGRDISVDAADKNILVLPGNSAVQGKLVDAKFFIGKGDTVLLVYQMGKVGSTSVYRSLCRKELPLPIYQVHYLSEKRLEEAVYWHTVNGFRYLPEHIAVAQGLRKFIGKHKQDVQWKIISLVRDPVALQVSIIFQNIKEAFPEAIQESGRVDKRKVIELVERYLADFDTRESHFIHWFDYEIRDVFGIDVYEYGFDREVGYSNIRSGNVEILVIKYEKFKECAQRAIEGFLGVNPIEIFQENVSKSKEFGAEYTSLLQEMKITPALCENILGTKLVRHFYNADEIHAFRERWSRKESTELGTKSL
jgi:glycosyltransferase involved in cell wall biosynthesis